MNSENRYSKWSWTKQPAFSSKRNQSFTLGRCKQLVGFQPSLPAPFKNHSSHGIPCWYHMTAAARTCSGSRPWQRLHRFQAQAAGLPGARGGAIYSHVTTMAKPLDSRNLWNAFAYRERGWLYTCNPSCMRWIGMEYQHHLMPFRETMPGTTLWKERLPTHKFCSPI